MIKIFTNRNDNIGTRDRVYSQTPEMYESTHIDQSQNNTAKNLEFNFDVKERYRNI